MSNLLKIGELARQTGLSIRTLHDAEVGLLLPSHRTEADHRLYSDQDIIRLQPILSLRQLGLSLREIPDSLKSPEFSWPTVIDLHRSPLREQIASSHAFRHFARRGNRLGNGDACFAGVIIKPNNPADGLTQLGYYFDPVGYPLVSIVPRQRRFTVQIVRSETYFLFSRK